MPENSDRQLVEDLIHIYSREIMACGHPKMCWKLTIPSLSQELQAGPVVVYQTGPIGFCTLCAELAEVRQAAEEAARVLIQNEIGLYAARYMQSKSIRVEVANEILLKINLLFHAEHQNALSRIVAKAVREAKRELITPQLVEDFHAAVAQGWCIPPNTGKTVDVDLGLAIVNNVIAVLRATLDADGSTSTTPKEDTK